MILTDGTVTLVGGEASGASTSTAIYTMPSVTCKRCDCMYVAYDYTRHYCDAYALQTKFGRLLMKYPYAEITLTATGWEIKVYE